MFFGLASGKKHDAILMDAPLWVHAPKLVLWFIFEALDLTLAIWITREAQSSSSHAACAHAHVQLSMRDSAASPLPVLLSAAQHTCASSCMVLAGLFCTFSKHVCLRPWGRSCRLMQHGACR